MAKRNLRKARSSPPTPTDTRRPRDWTAIALAGLALLTQVAFLPSAGSPFRLIKMAVLLGGLGLIGGLVLAGRLWRGSLALPRGLLAGVLAAYPLLLLVSTAWAVNPLRAVEGAVAAAVWVAGVLLVATLSERSWQLVVLWCGAGAAVSVGEMLLQAVGAKYLVIGTSARTSRMALTGFTGNPADLAMAAMLVLPLLLVRAGKRRKGPARWYLPAFLAIAVLGTQTFTAIAALLLLAILWLWHNQRRRFWPAIAAVLVVVIAVAAVSGIGGRVSKRLRDGSLHVLLSGRTDGWTASLQMIRNQPLLGEGGACFTHSFYPKRLAWLEEHDRVGEKRGVGTHFETAHCDPLQVAAELGLLGLAWLGALLVVLIRNHHRDPLLQLAAAASVPFLLLHYPAHLAVGLLPLALLLGGLLRDAPRISLAPVPAARRLLAVVLVVLSALYSCWQGRRVEIDLWNGQAQRIVQQVDTALQAGGDRTKALKLLAVVERRALDRLQRRAEDRPRLLYLVGHIQLVRQFAPGAASSFRSSFELWPREDAEYGLGLALAAQGRRDEAVQHLVRVSRLNPSLAGRISEPSLRHRVGRELRLIEQSGS